MSEPFVSEIRMMGFKFAPKDWAQCDGATIAINQNQVLYSLIGDAFGGDGRTDFALPDLRGRVPVHQPNQRGTAGGQEGVILDTSELPSHTHVTSASQNSADSQEANDMYPGSNSKYGIYANFDQGNNVTLNDTTLAAAGGTVPHNNVQPSEVVNFCIALNGLYPSRN